MGYIKTEEGQAAFRARSALLSARQRAAFIMFDGIKSVEQILASTAGLGVAQLDIEHMVAHGLLKEAATAGSSSAAVASPPTAQPARPVVVTPAPLSASAPSPALSASPGVATASQRTPQERYRQAMPLATQLTASLGLRGFLLNLGVESASGYDELLALFPKIQSAVGVKKCEELERVLKS